MKQLERRPCQFHTVTPCGELGEAVEFKDGIHFVCKAGIEEWNQTHVGQIQVRHN